MIGIKIQNSVWEKALLALLGERAEIWQAQKDYQIIITDLSLKKIGGLDSTQLIGLGNSDFKYTLPLPFKVEKLQSLLSKMSNYENKVFIWNSIHRQLTNKKNKQEYFLTEKEAALIDFLVCCKNHTATKKELLKNVWKYKMDTETHTVETTFNTLRQKITPYGDKIITYTQSGYKLI